MQIFIKFWPVLVLILVILIWFLGSRKNKELKITNMKIWVITIATILVLALVLMIYNFSTSENQSPEYKRIESYDVKDNPDNEDQRDIEIKKFEIDNIPQELP